MTKQEDLLDKYYRGETSSEEEEVLKDLYFNNENDSAEKEMFSYFQNENIVPADLETSVYLGLIEKVNNRKKMKIIFLIFSSIAATALILLSIYLNLQKEKDAKMENNFLVMEKALFQVSESIQPDEKKEIFVLWVDNDLEIIIN